MSRTRKTNEEIKEDVDNLVISMFAKLADNSNKPNWKYSSIIYLVFRLEQELQELKESIANGDTENSKLECADIANFCMMIHSKLMEE